MHWVYADMNDSEKQVARYLTELDLWWVYESPIFVYDDKNRPRVWTPDFYVPKLGMYIEVCGSERFGESGYRFRDDIYRNNGYYVIFVHLYKEERKWKSYLISRMNEIEESRHEQLMKALHSLLSKVSLNIER